MLSANKNDKSITTIHESINMYMRFLESLQNNRSYDANGETTQFSCVNHAGIKPWCHLPHTVATQKILLDIDAFNGFLFPKYNNQSLMFISFNMYYLLTRIQIYYYYLYYLKYQNGIICWHEFKFIIIIITYITFYYLK